MAGPPLSADLIEIFLDELARSFSVTQAASKAGIARATIYFRCQEDAAFKERFDIAMDLGRKACLDEYIRRAMGYDEPVFYRGERVDTMKKYSDANLETIVKTHFKEYRDHSISEITGPQGGPLKLQDATDEEIDAMIAQTQQRLEKYGIRLSPESIRKNKERQRRIPKSKRRTSAKTAAPGDASDA